MEGKASGDVPSQNIKGDSLGSLELYQYQPAWGKFSIDPFCVKIEAYLRFVGVDFKIKNSNNPYSSPTSTLPMLLVNGEKMLGDHHQILDYLCEKRYDLNYHLTPSQLADCEAFTSLVEEKLQNAMLWNWWMEPDNYEVVRFAYACMMPFPINYIIPPQMQKKIGSRLTKLGVTKDQAYKDATRAYSSLALRIGNNKFFFGDSVSTLDVSLFAHLECQMTAPITVSPLRELIEKHQVLVDYHKRIQGMLRDSIAFDVNNVKSNTRFTPEKPKPSTQVHEKTEEEKTAERWSKMFVGGAIMAMFAYVGNQYWHKGEEEN